MCAFHILYPKLGVCFDKPKTFRISDLRRINGKLVQVVK